MKESKIEMIKLISALLCVWFSFIIPDQVYSQTNCDFVKKVQDYQGSVKLRNKSKTIVLDSTTFNLDNYLGMFNKLKLDSDKICKVYYDYNLFFGKPIIYVTSKSFNLTEYIERITQRRLNAKPPIPYLTNKEILNYEDVKQDNMARFAQNEKVRAFNNLIPENSEEGFFQFLFFYVVGEQFALIGHSNMDQKIVLCTKQDFNAEIERYSNKKLGILNRKQSKVLLITDPTPIIKLNESICSITWYELETYHGLFQKTYIIERNSPFRVQETKKNQIFAITPDIEY